MFVNEYHEKAQNLIDSKELDKALNMFNKALDLNPDSAAIFNDRAVLYLHLNKEYLSLMDFDKAVTLDPDYAYRYASRAYGKDFFGDTDGALLDYQKAIELDPEDPVAQNNLGVLLEKKGYQQKAKKHYDRADILAEHEKGFKEKMNEIDPIPYVKPENGTKIQPKKIENEDLKENSNSKSDIVKDIFIKKSIFKEFVSFLKNGFKIKEENDQTGKS